jgi:hypothetical protein
MVEKVNMSVSVALSFNSDTKITTPRHIKWNGRIHRITKIGLHHTYRRGRTLFHVFSVASPTLFFRLVLDSETLHWKLEEISDGLGS